MITIISGTNRKNSKTKIIAERYQKILQQKGREAIILDLAEIPFNFVDSNLYKDPEQHREIVAYRKIIEGSDKFVFVVPEYNNSFPGVLKVFIDGLKYPDSFSGKKCAFVGLSSGVQGGSIALSHLNDILNYMGMNVLGLQVKLGKISEYLSGTEINNPIYNKFIDLQAEQLINF